MAQPSKSTDSNLNFTAGTKTTPQLQEGNAKLIVERLERLASKDWSRRTRRDGGYATADSQR
jgi:hypothetical protein